MLSGVSAQEDNTSEFKNLKAKAERGDAEAQYRLGHCYSDGDVVPKDEKKAVFWFRKAANQGHAGGGRHQPNGTAQGLHRRLFVLRSAR